MANKNRMRRIKFNTGRIIKGKRAAVTRAFDQVGQEMEAAIKKRLDKPFPPASAPGRPPHKRTGVLQGRTEVVRKGRVLTVRTPQYGIWLEGGTSRMAKRPFILPVIDQKKRWTKRINVLIRKNSKSIEK